MIIEAAVIFYQFCVTLCASAGSAFFAFQYQEGSAISQYIAAVIPLLAGGTEWISIFIYRDQVIAFLFAQYPEFCVVVYAATDYDISKAFLIRSNP